MTVAAVGFFVPAAELAGKTKAADFNRHNSQTIGLAVGSTDYSLYSLGGAETIIVDGNALQPDPGLAGDSREAGRGSDQISLYVIRRGESLSEIAEMFGVSVNTIVWANDLASASAIREGQMLLILPISGVRHIVAAGETVASIAQKYKGDEREIVQFNGLTRDGKLAAGQVIIIPDGEEGVLGPGRPAGSRIASGAAGSGPNLVGYFLRPLEGGRKTQGLHGYNGVDLATYAGAPILAAAPGTVIVSKTGGWNGGYGNYIVLEHPNGTQTLYAHNSENIVFVGQPVVQGQVIGYVGSAGRSSGPHVHFEVRGAKNPF